MQGPASTIIIGLKSWRPHSSVIQIFFTLPSFQVKLPWPHFSWDRLPSAAFSCGLGEQSSGHPPVLFFIKLWAEKLVFIKRCCDSVCPPTVLHLSTADGVHGKHVSFVCVPTGFSTMCSAPVQNLGKSIHHWCYGRESDKTSSFSHLALKHRYWFSVTWLQAWLILCKTEDFTAILQKDLKSPDFP